MEQKRHGWVALTCAFVLPLAVLIGAYFATYGYLVSPLYFVRTDPISGGRVVEARAAYPRHWESQCEWFFSPAYQVDRYLRPRKWFVKPLKD